MVSESPLPRRLPTREAKLKAQRVLQHAEETLEAKVDQLVRRETLRRMRHNRRLLPLLLPWLRYPVAAGEVRMDVMQAFVGGSAPPSARDALALTARERRRARVARRFLARAEDTGMATIRAEEWTLFR